MLDLVYMSSNKEGPKSDENASGKISDDFEEIDIDEHINVNIEEY